MLCNLDSVLRCYVYLYKITCIKKLDAFLKCDNYKELKKTLFFQFGTCSDIQGNSMHMDINKDTYDI